MAACREKAISRRRQKPRGVIAHRSAKIFIILYLFQNKSTWRDHGGDEKAAGKRRKRQHETAASSPLIHGLCDAFLANEKWGISLAAKENNGIVSKARKTIIGNGKREWRRKQRRQATATTWQAEGRKKISICHIVLMISQYINSNNGGNLKKHEQAKTANNMRRIWHENMKISGFYCLFLH